LELDKLVTIFRGVIPDYPIAKLYTLRRKDKGGNTKAIAYGILLTLKLLNAQ
jgi:hypothetical protein